MLVAIRRGIGLATATAALFAAGASPSIAGDEEALFGKKYHSVSVTKDGQPKPLVKETKLRVQFFHAEEEDELAWHAGCNRFGYAVIVLDELLDTDYGSSTEIGCPGDLARQDIFFAHFFKRDPAWSASGRNLTLSTERVTIDLRRRPTVPE